MSEKQYVYKVRVKRTSVQYADVEVMFDGRGEGMAAQLAAVYADRDELWSVPEVAVENVESSRVREVQVNCEYA